MFSNRNRRLRHNLPLIMLEGFFGSFRLFYPVGILVYQSLTGSFAMAMSIFAVASLALAFFEIPTGIISDKWGRKKTFIMGALSEFLAIICYTICFFDFYHSLSS